MGERYTRIFTLPQGRLYQTGAPVLLLAGALLKDTQTGRVLAQLKFQSIDNRSIKAMKVALAAFDSFGSVLMGVDEFQYLDLNVGRNESFGSKTAIPMPSSDTRSFSCRCLNIVFTDGSTWTASGEAWLPLVDQSTLEQSLGNELADQFRRDTNQKAPYSLAHDRDLWCCVCGAVNHDGEAACCACDAKRQTLADAADPALLRERLAEYQHQQAEQAAAQAAREAEEREKQRVKRKKALIIATPLAVVAALAILFFAWLWPDVIQPSRQYKQAQALFDAEEYEAAAAAFDALLDYKDSADQALEARYRQAGTLLDSGRYPEAKALFSELGEYRDSADSVTYSDALALYQDGDREAALDLFGTILDLRDSRSYACEIEEAILAEKYEAVLSAAEKSNAKQAIAAYAEAEAFLAGCVAYKEAPASELALESKYAYGTMLEKRERYEEAASVFSELEDYKDSAEKRQTNYDKSPAGLYEQAVQCEEKGDWTQAAELFMKAGSYQDAPERSKAAIYQNGIQLYENGQYADAILQFKKTPGYEGVDRYLQSAYVRTAASVKEPQSKANTLSLITDSKLSAEDQALYFDACYSLGKAFEDRESYADAFKWYKLSGINDYEQRMDACNKAYMATPRKLTNKQWQTSRSNFKITAVTAQYTSGRVTFTVYYSAVKSGTWYLWVGFSKGAGGRKYGSFSRGDSFFTFTLSVDEELSYRDSYFQETISNWDVYLTGDAYANQMDWDYWDGWFIGNRSFFTDIRKDLYGNLW